MDGLGPAAQRRLMKELRDWNRSDAADHDGLVLRPREDHRLDEWQCWLPGPKGTPYEGDAWRRVRARSTCVPRPG